MKKEKFVSILGAIFLTFIGIFLTQSCTNKTEKDPVCTDPFAFEKAGRLINHTECKNTGGIIETFTSKTDECITFIYYANYNILQLSHINAGFNCCPKKISASYKFTNDTVKIFEKQAEAGCKCECLYDVNYELRNLSPGVYHIEIFGPLTDGKNKPQLAFDIDIVKHADSTFCMYRGFYPWME